MTYIVLKAPLNSNQPNLPCKKIMISNEVPSKLVCTYYSLHFYPCGASDVRVIAIIMCPSVCLSVCLCLCVSHAGIVSKRLNITSRKQHHMIAQGLQFSDAKSRWWRIVPFPLKCALKVPHPLLNTTISTNICSQHLNRESWRKRSISTNRKSTTRSPTSHR